MAVGDNTWGFEPIKRAHVAAGQHLTGGLDFFRITTSVDLTVADNLDLLIQTISTRTQPVIQGAVKSAALVTATAADLVTLGATGAASGETWYTLVFAAEHNFAWADVGALKAAVVASGFAVAAELAVEKVVF